MCRPDGVFRATIPKSERNTQWETACVPGLPGLTVGCPDTGVYDHVLAEGRTQLEKSYELHDYPKCGIYDYMDTKEMKGIIWMGSSREDLRTFPDTVRDESRICTL